MCIRDRLKITGKLFSHVATAIETYDRILSKLAKSAPPRKCQKEWVSYMNQARHTAEEYVLNDFIYGE